MDQSRVRGVCGYVHPPPHETSSTDSKAEATADGGNQLHESVFLPSSCLAAVEKYWPLHSSQEPDKHEHRTKDDSSLIYRFRGACAVYLSVSWQLHYPKKAQWIFYTLPKLAQNCLEE